MWSKNDFLKTPSEMAPAVTWTRQVLQLTRSWDLSDSRSARGKKSVRQNTGVISSAAGLATGHLKKPCPSVPDGIPALGTLRPTARPVKRRKRERGEGLGRDGERRRREEERRGGIAPHESGGPRAPPKPQAFDISPVCQP